RLPKFRGRSLKFRFTQSGGWIIFLPVRADPGGPESGAPGVGPRRPGMEAGCVNLSIADRTVPAPLPPCRCPQGPTAPRARALEPAVDSRRAPLALPPHGPAET